jgi:hypothetical protein
MTPSTTVAPHEVYSGRTTSRPAVVASSAGAVLIVVLGQESNTGWTNAAFLAPLALVAVGILAMILTASTVAVVAGPNGFITSWGPMGWPRFSYAINDIADSEVIDIPWWTVSYGAWWTPKRTNCTVRSGPAVKLTLRNRRTVIITAPDPVQAVAALDLRMRKRQPQSGILASEQ